MFFKSREREAYEHIREEIEIRLARTGAPQEISDFLLNRWSFLLAGIYFNHGDQHPDWEAGWQTVNALLWSLAPKQDREETKQVLRLLPTLLGRIQDGCQAMNLDSAESDALSSQLVMMHAAVIRAGLQSQTDEEGSMTHLGLDTDRIMGDEEWASLGQKTPIVAIPDARSESGSEVGIDGLKVGNPILLTTAEGEKALFLQWMSPMGGMYLFADADGLDTVSLTRARLAERLRNGKAKLL